MPRFSNTHSPLKIILIAWLLFATVYFFKGGYDQARIFVAQRAYDAGAAEGVARLMKDTSGCKAIPINAGNTRTALINADCLSPPDSGEVEGRDLPEE